MKLQKGRFGKSEFNTCPVCGLPRGKGPHEFAHGKCAEVRAKTEGKQAQFPGHETLGRITKEQHEKAQNRRKAERYKNDKLPDWMYS